MLEGIDADLLLTVERLPETLRDEMLALPCLGETPYSQVSGTETEPWWLSTELCLMCPDAPWSLAWALDFLLFLPVKSEFQREVAGPLTCEHQPKMLCEHVPMSQKMQLVCCKSRQMKLHIEDTCM